MALKTVLDNFAKAQKEYEEKSKTLGVEAQKEIASAIAAVLPKGHVFGWTQATPYFNDGEPCVFRVLSGYVLTDEEYKAKSELHDGQEVYGKQKGELADLGELWAKLEAKQNEPLLLAAFGDHAMVIVKSDGSYKRTSYEDHD